MTKNGVMAKQNCSAWSQTNILISWLAGDTCDSYSHAHAVNILVSNSPQGYKTPYGTFPRQLSPQSTGAFCSPPTSPYIYIYVYITEKLFWLIKISNFVCQFVNSKWEAKTVDQSVGPPKYLNINKIYIKMYAGTHESYELFVHKYLITLLIASDDRQPRNETLGDYARSRYFIEGEDVCMYMQYV